MATDADIFKVLTAEMIKSWDPENIEYKLEVNLGMRFDKTPRKIDIVVFHKKTGKTIGIECKLQRTNGTAYEKLPYALDDCLASPIKTLIVFAGGQIRIDMRAKLIASGIGIELGYKINQYKKIYQVLDPQNILLQRVFIELGLNWLDYATSSTLSNDSYGDAYHDPGGLTKDEKAMICKAREITKEELEAICDADTNPYRGL